MNFMMRSYLHGRKYKVCEIKVSICVVYTLGRRKFKEKNQQDWKANISSITKPHNFYAPYKES